ncbi:MULTISPECIES: DUF3883 domain-containing protein [unclassified Brevundimonas]|uniref:DUF3883 domain-containing protein n=1 Tax=unclassified Brevundimonas TaxID=2622653 RepID=UPI0025B873F0|nr:MULTISPECIES: DUF3883 domain-containing protein [unclassified Brevundimonas]
MALVLVHNAVVANPAHQWDDVEGVHYHYPSKYRGKIVTGAPFVYYRGVHRPGGKRGPAEYFGAGRIGDIWPDPDRPGAWYCAIDDYQKFAAPVPAKVDGQNREIIPVNLWRDGVRRLDLQVYTGILAVAGLTPVLVAAPSPGSTSAPISAPLAAPIAPPVAAAIETAELIVPPKRAGPRRNGQGGRGGERRSRQAKAVGDWAEAVALTYLQASGGLCVHRAAIGETPGWDIDYVDAAGRLQRVEVKGTVAAAFTGVELTANEWAAAHAHGDDYWLCLVADCYTARPKLQLLRNPAATLAAGDWSARPSVMAVAFAPTADDRHETEKGDEV